MSGAGGTTRDELRADALAAIEKAYDVVVALCDGRKRWTMSVPACPDSDPDLVIGDALRKARAALLDAPECAVQPTQAKSGGRQRDLDLARQYLANYTGADDYVLEAARLLSRAKTGGRQ